MGFPGIVVVVPRDPSVQSDSLPRYLVSDSNIEDYNWNPDRIEEEPRVQLFAQIFGFSLGLSSPLKYHNRQLTRISVFRLQDYRPIPETPYFTRAPELTFYELSDGQVEKEWGLPSDVWSMACTVGSAS
jgi:hypothetical protein